MFSNSRRHLLIVVLLLVGVGLTWGQRLSSAAKLPIALPTPESSPGQLAADLPEYVYFLDVEGWYRITPYETVVRSSIDLTADSTEAMAAALPETIGEWQQVGNDQFMGDDPGVVYYLNEPTVALQRVYQNPTGHKVTLALIGNKGEDSFLLFSHTPETCYPGRLWQVTENRRESALLDDRSDGAGPESQPMYAQYLLTEHAETGEKLMVLFWYLWDNPQRNSEEGVLSVRVNLYVPAGESEETVLARAWDFIRALFPATVPWERF